MVISARKRSLGQGNIFTPVCHSVHRGGVHGCSRGRVCMVAPVGVHGLIWGGHAWFYSGGACVVLFGGHAWLLLGGHAWLLRGACTVLFGGACVVLFRGGMRGFIQGGMCGFIRGGMHGCSGGACMVLFGGACVVLFRGGVCGFFSFFGYNEIQSMSGRYASYWNAFLFKVILQSLLLGIRFNIRMHSSRMCTASFSCRLGGGVSA